ncbi:MAG: M1 family metallopeptidase [Chitinophagaceae bacterium]|nr:M1 family metallopeptidase [Chitinophagaceae bacterium]
MIKLLFSLLLLCTVTLPAQTNLYIPRNIQTTYDNGTRTTLGTPGKNYWQNTAIYKIDVSFDPGTRLLNGNVQIDYTNNSPDTLHEIWFKLYPNLYKKGSITLTKISPADLSEGLIIDTLKIAGAIPETSPKIDGTNMSVPGQTLLPHQSVSFNIQYHYTLNKGSHNRTGKIDEGAAFIAYFFPRIAVYDDIDGWNKNPYLGPQEFYNDFCNFNVSISVPKGFAVWATGDLANCKDVFATNICDRIALAETSNEVINIIDSVDLVNKNYTATNAINTWKFNAANVTDFVFAVSDHYLWKATSVVVDSTTNRRTRVDVAFNPAHKDFYEVIDFARQTVYAMSHQFPKWPFPYPHETVFDGLDQMEYPMMVNDNPVDNREDAITLTDHEIFHTMFPFYMGTNETKYGWMDEGWATLGEWLISPLIDTTIKDEYGMRPYEKAAGKEIDLPIITPTTQLFNEALFLNSYPKPAMGYLFVKDLLGDSLFTKALHYYITQWQGKHPVPYDFFNCINFAAGKNLNWFWKKWFFDSGFPDLAISKVTHKTNDYTLIITSKGTKPVPIDLTISYTDGTKENVHKNISVWEKGNKITTIKFKAKAIVKNLELGSLYVPDVNKKDNMYVQKAAK